MLQFGTRLIEKQVRLQYGILNHAGFYTRVRCQDVAQKRQISETRVRGVDELLEWARTYHLRGNLFIGRNPVNEAGKVVRATAFSLDIDPVRPASTASSPAQLSKALSMGQRIRRRYGDGNICTSGNGALLLYLVDPDMVPDLQQFQEKCREFEKAVRDEFQTTEVKIDATYDLARLVKLMGSVSTKGEKRLWRHARFLCRPIFRAKQSRFLDAIERVGGDKLGVSGLDGTGDSQDRTSVCVPELASNDESGKLSPSARLAMAEESLRRLSPARADEYDSWLRVGIALKEFGPVGLLLWEKWSSQSPKFNSPNVCRTKWGTFRADQHITVGTLKYWADQDDPMRTGVLPGLPGVRLLGQVGERDGTKLWTPGQPIGTSSEGRGRDNASAISTGFKWLDGKLNGGYRQSTVYAVEACTNVGKSSFIVQAAFNSCEAGRRVLLVTTEAAIEEICYRYWALGTGIPASEISNGRLDGDRAGRLDEFKRYFGAHKLGVWYTVSPKTDEIERQINEFKPDILLWDYYQHFETGTDSRQIQLASLARWFESTALRYQIPLVVAAQLHEKYDFKVRKRVPSIKDDIKDCKVLNDAAKVVIVLDWDHKEQPQESSALVRMSLDKNKGPMGETKILLNRQIPRFEEI